MPVTLITGYNPRVLDPRYSKVFMKKVGRLYSFLKGPKKCSSVAGRAVLKKNSAPRTEEECIEIIRTASSLEGKLYGLNELRKVRGR